MKLKISTSVHAQWVAALKGVGVEHYSQTWLHMLGMQLDLRCNGCAWLFFAD